MKRIRRLMDKLIAPPGRKISLKGEKSQVIATRRQTNPPSVLVERGDRTVLGMLVPAASGAKYEGANLVFWEHQGEAHVTWMDVELKCKPVW